MSDRTNALLVVLDHDIRVDDVQSIIAAIRLIKNVVDVKANVVDANSHVAYARVKSELTQKLFRALE